MLASEIGLIDTYCHITPFLGHVGLQRYLANLLATL